MRPQGPTFRLAVSMRAFALCSHAARRLAHGMRRPLSMRWPLVALTAAIASVPSSVLAGSDPSTAPAIGPAPAASNALPLPAAVPLPIREVREQAKDLFRASRTGDWGGAGRALSRLAGFVRNVRNETIGDSSDVDRIESLRALLSLSVRAHDRVGTMSAANEITRIVADLSDPYAPLVPTDVDRLAYYGRAIEVAAEQGNPAKLRTQIVELRRTWQRVRPRAIDRHLDGTAQIDAAIARLDASLPAIELARAAADELGGVDTLENAFFRAG